MTAKAQTIIDAILDHVRTYVHFGNPDHAIVVALWILHTWTFSPSFPRSPYTTPYLYVYSDGPESGKTRLIETIKPLCRNSEQVGSMSAAAMYSLIEDVRPTLLIDEVDTVFRDRSSKNEDLRNTLNTGYTHNGYTFRKMGREVEKFSTFCAKLLAGIKGINVEIPETVQTRSIPIHMVKSEGRVKPRYEFQAGPLAEELADEISAWITANGEAVIDYMPEPIESMGDRAFEISMPLLQLAHALGVEQEAREALIRLLAPPKPKEKPEIAMLRTIREYFDASGLDKAYSRDLAELFGWTTKHLSQMLKPFGIDGSNTMSLPGRKPAKGYWKSQFQDAWSKYL